MQREVVVFLILLFAIMPILSISISSTPMVAAQSTTEFNISNVKGTRESADLKPNEIITGLINIRLEDHAKLLYEEQVFYVPLNRLVDIKAVPPAYVVINLLKNEKVIHDEYIRQSAGKQIVIKQGGETIKIPKEMMLEGERLRIEREKIPIIREEGGKKIILTPKGIGVKEPPAPEPKTIEDINNLLKTPQAMFLIVALFFAIMISLWTDVFTALIALIVLLVVGAVIEIIASWILIIIALVASAIAATYISKGVTG